MGPTVCAEAIHRTECPLWVKSRRRNRSAECLLYPPRKRTLINCVEVEAAEAYPFRQFIQDRMSGQMVACAWRPTRIPRCCKQTPASPGYCMICVLVVIFSVKGISDARDAI